MDMITKWSCIQDINISTHEYIERNIAGNKLVIHDSDMQGNTKNVSIEPFLQVILIEEQKKILLGLLKKLLDIFHNLSIDYIMYGGTLLGSYR